jgi:hypothetical protein
MTVEELQDAIRAFAQELSNAMDSVENAAKAKDVNAMIRGLQSVKTAVHQLASRV